MGITIHYDVKIKEKNKEIIPKIINFVEQEAKKQKFEAYKYVDTGRYELCKLYDINHKLKHQWWHFYGNDKTDKPDTNESYRTEQVGIYVNYPTSESFTVAFTYNKIDKTYVLSGFTKTQVFNDSERGNIVFHVWIINLLLKIKSKFAIDINIRDEGDYYFTEKQRQESIDYLLNRHKEHTCYDKEEDMKYVKRWRVMKPFDIKNLITAMGENLTVINKIGKQLKAVGWDEKQIVLGQPICGNKKTVTLTNNKDGK